MAAIAHCISARPRGIVVLAGVVAAGGALFLVSGSALLFADQLGIYRGALGIAGRSENVQIENGLVALAAGVLLLVLAVGLFQLRLWAWAVSVLAMGVTVGFSIYEWLTGLARVSSQLFTWIAAASMLLYLLAPHVIRAFFAKPATNATSPRR